MKRAEQVLRQSPNATASECLASGIRRARQSIAQLHSCFLGPFAAAYYTLVATHMHHKNRRKYYTDTVSSIVLWAQQTLDTYRSTFSLQKYHSPAFYLYVVRNVAHTHRDVLSFTRYIREPIKLYNSAFFFFFYSRLCVCFPSLLMGRIKGKPTDQVAGLLLRFLIFSPFFSFILMYAIVVKILLLCLHTHRLSFFTKHWLYVNIWSKPFWRSCLILCWPGSFFF